MAGALFRKKLNRRQGTADLKCATSDVSDDISTSPTASLESKDSSQKVTGESIPQDDLSTTPLPPQALLSVDEGSSSPRRLSPSRSLLQRYRSRSPLNKVPTLDTSAPLCRKQPDSGKETQFMETFDVVLPSPQKTHSEPATPNAKVPRKALQVIHGVESEKRGTGGPADLPEDDNTEKKLDAPTLPQIEVADFANERHHKTRSQSRRGQQVQMPRPVRIYGGNSALEKLNSPADAMKVPRALPIRQKHDKKLPRTPSPSEEQKNEKAMHSDSTTVSATPFNSPCKGDDPNFEQSLQPRSNGLDSTGSPELPSSPLQSPKRSSSSSEDTSPAYHEAPSPADQVPLQINIPIHDATKSSHLQWVSSLASCSRPFSTWGSAKRWTCHKCGSQTIVEQSQCSNLECKHSRCLDKCLKLREGKRGQH